MQANLKAVLIAGYMTNGLHLTLPLEPVRLAASDLSLSQRQPFHPPAEMNDLPASDILIMEEQLAQDVFPLPKMRKRVRKGRKRPAPPLIDLN